MNGDYTWPEGQDSSYTTKDLVEYFSDFEWSSYRADNGEWKLFLHQISEELTFASTHGLQIICAPTNKAWSYWPEPHQEQYILYCLNELPKRVKELEVGNAQNK